MNPVVYFEVPVNDLDRAEHFYTEVFGFRFERALIDGYEMSLLPFDADQEGITGALAKGDVYKPGKEGAILYFNTEDMNLSLRKVLDQKGKILYPAKINERYGFVVAEFEDSEGNRVALHQKLKKL